MLLSIPLAVSLVAFVWEYSVLDMRTDWRPSYALEKAASAIRTTFERLGEWAAWISSFYTYIKWEKLLETGHRLFKPIVEILAGPYFFCKGYAEYAWEFTRPYLIVAGSLTLAAIVIYVGYKFGWWRRLARRVSPLVSRYNDFWVWINTIDVWRTPYEGRTL